MKAGVRPHAARPGASASRRSGHTRLARGHRRCGSESAVPVAAPVKMPSGKPKADGKRPAISTGGATSTPARGGPALASDEAGRERVSRNGPAGPAAAPTSEPRRHRTPSPPPRQTQATEQRWASGYTSYHPARARDRERLHRRVGAAYKKLPARLDDWTAQNVCVWAVNEVLRTSSTTPGRSPVGPKGRLLTRVLVKYGRLRANYHFPHRFDVSPFWFPYLTERYSLGARLPFRRGGRNLLRAITRATAPSRHDYCQTHY